MSIQELHRRARELKEQRDSILAQRRADAEADQLMTPQQRTEYVAGWKRQLDKQFEPKFAELREDARDYADTVKSKAAKARPTFDPDNAAALVRTEQAWRNVVLPQLEKGRPLREALRGADADAVLGAQRFAHAWAQANSKSDRGVVGMEFDGSSGPMTGRVADTDTAFVDAAITHRLIELSDDTAAAALRASLTIDAELDALGATVHHIETGEGSALELAIGVALARQTPGAEDESSADQGEARPSIADAIGAYYGGAA